MAESSQHAIETMLLEERRYPPPAEFAAQANARPEIYERELRGVLGDGGRASGSRGSSRSTTLYEWELPYAKWFLGGKLNVSYNCVDRHVEAGTGRQGRLLLGGRARGRAARGHLRRAPARGRRASRTRLKTLGVDEGHARRDLHGHGPRAAGRDARLRAARRPAHRRLRRLLGRLALRPDGRHGLRGADHPGRGLAARHDGAAEARRPTRRWPTRRACAPPSSCAAPATRCR